MLEEEIRAAFKKCYDEVVDNYEHCCEDIVVAKICTRKDEWSETTTYSFVAFHPAYIELCWNKGGKASVCVERIAMFATHDVHMNALVKACTILIEEHYRY